MGKQLKCLRLRGGHPTEMTKDKVHHNIDCKRSSLETFLPIRLGKKVTLNNMVSHAIKIEVQILAGPNDTFGEALAQH